MSLVWEPYSTQSQAYLLCKVVCIEAFQVRGVRSNLKLESKTRLTADDKHVKTAPAPL